MKVICIVGPTGVGKSKYSIDLAKRIGGEIINGDAFQVYKHLNIGTAKITSEEMDGVKHHLIDFLELNEEFNVVVFQKLAREKIAEINSRNKVAIVVGGSGFYIKALLYDYQFAKESIKKDFSAYTNEELYQMLLDKDEKKALTTHMNNRKRVERALNIEEENQIGEILYDALIIGLTINRDVLYSNIDNRVDIMMKMGLEQEIRSVIKDDSYFDLNALQAIGYKEFRPYLNHEYDLDRCIELIKRNSRRYAKKQYTWFNHQMHVNWFDKSELENADKLVDQFLKSEGSK